jgi:hypothetical protein
MKVDYEYPVNILKKGRKLGESTIVSDIEEAIKQIKIYVSFVTSSEEHLSLTLELVDLYVKLISYVDSTQLKFWYFKMAAVQLCEAVYLVSSSGNAELKDGAVNFEQRFSSLFNVVGGNLNDSYAFLKSFQFKKAVEDKYGNKAILRYLKEEPEKKYDRLYNQIVQQEDVFLSVEQSIDKAYLEVSLHNGERSRPNIISMREMVPFIEYTDEDVVGGLNFDHTLYFEMTEEIKSRQKQGKLSFVRYLLENYEITINDNYILTISDEEVELYSKQIFEFFYRNNFNDTLEKELVRFIQRIINDERWL